MQYSRVIFEAKTPEGHLIRAEYNPLKNEYSGNVVHRANGRKLLLPSDILDALNTLAAVEQDIQTSNYDDSDELQKMAHDIKFRHVETLRNLVGTAVDLLMDTQKPKKKKH